MVDTNNLMITSSGLTRVSRELINKRKYDKSKISIIGNPIVINGVVSSLNSESYAKYSSLELQDAENIKVNIAANYTKPNSEAFQCLWSLLDINTPEATLSLVVYPTKLCLLSGRDIVISIENLTFINNTNIQISFELTSNSYSITLTNNKERNVYAGSTPEPIAIQNYSQIQVGHTNIYPDNFWVDSIDLASLLVFKNNSLYYAPSTEPYFRFTHILLSDGTIPLTDNSVPVLNRIYEFKINEISRTGSSILLKTTIGSNVHLSIAQVGLYIETEDGPVLFALMSGLAIQKGEDIGYDLIFNVNLNLDIVNTTALPSIILTDEDYAVLSDFTNIEKIHAYITTNMERIVTMNALNLGYGRTLVLMRNFLKSIICNQNCIATQAYSRIKGRIKPTVEKTFNREKITVVGSPTLTSNGTLYSITKSDYCTSQGSLDFSSDWELDTSFKTGVGGSEQVIIDYYSPVVNHPLVLGITSKNKCFLKLGRAEELKISNTSEQIEYTLVREPLSDINIVGGTLYAWKNNISSYLYNYGVSITGDLYLNNGLMYNFSATNYATSKENLSLKEGSVFTVKFLINSDSLSTQTIISSPSNYTFKVEEQNGKLLYSVGNGTSWTSEKVLGSTAIIQTNTEYELKLSYSSGVLSGTVNGVLDFSVTASEIGSSLVRFGLSFDNANPLDGTIDLLSCNYTFNGNVVWNGASASQHAYTSVTNPSTSTKLYDKNNVEFTNLSVTNFDTAFIVNQEMFDVSSTDIYNVKVVREGNTYTVYKSTERNPRYSLVYSISNAKNINQSTVQYLGVQNSEEIKSSFTGAILLLNYNLSINGTENNFITKEERNTELKDFFPFYDYPYSYYKIKNLRDPNSSWINFFEGSITGISDEIDFSNELSSTLCIKADLKDGSDKLLVAKVNTKDNSKYFTIEFKDYSLITTIFMEYETIVLTKEYGLTNFRDVTTSPISIFITSDLSSPNPAFSMFVNNTKVDSKGASSRNFLNASNFVITNYLEKEDTNVNYVNNILSFVGLLSSDDIYYINNLLETNF